MDHGQWQGIFAATPLPLTDGLEIDEEEMRRLIRFLMGVKGINGLLCTARAGDVWVLSRKERRRVIEIHTSEVNGAIPVVAGVQANATWEVIEMMKDAKAAGASAALVLPPETLRGTTELGPDAPFQFFSAIAKAVDIPIVLFQYPVTRGFTYTPQTLAKLAEIESVVAVKESTWDIKRLERDLWAMKSAKRKISILTGNDTLLFPTFLHGVDGALVGLASLTPHWVVGLFQAMQQGDIARAKEINDRLFPITELLYETPGFSYKRNAAIREALFMLGVLKKQSVPRPPLQPLTEKDRKLIQDALEQSGLRSFYQSLGMDVR
ncbi:MAG: dihydrodipicolinate synthase family protein [Chloroflexi bacterium]|nr:dihydrodipicolinate synthase family protein [Chloroflexota bacterium]